jgi:anti-anti-sigma regulatory factor
MNQTQPARSGHTAPAADLAAISTVGAAEVHRLPAELTIYQVAACAEQALHWLVDQDASAPAATTMRLRGDAVEDIDSAGVQLLLSLERSLERRGRRLDLRAPSPALRQALECFGVADLLADEPESLP